MPAGFTVWRGVSGGFRRDLDLSRRGPRLGRFGVRAGYVGWSRSASPYLTAGVLTVRAAVRFDPAQPVGLDAGIKTLSAQPYGPALPQESTLYSGPSTIRKSRSATPSRMRTASW